MADADPIQRLNAALEGRYRIEHELGEGGMATVYLAEDVKHGRQVAVKVLRPELAQALGPERFLREIRVTAGLDHPHIVPLLDSGQVDGFLYYAMPYVEGQTLRERLEQEKQLPIDEALRITGEVADALAYAHGLGVVHRDIKPSNILLSGRHARLADFGVARAVEEAGEDALTATGTAIGTPTYMSPEQASGAEEIDERSDVYSLGCVTFEMLAGEPPYTASTPAALLGRKMSTGAPSLRALRPAVPDHIDIALDRALDPTPVDRFPDAAAFMEALRGPDGPGRADVAKGHSRVLAAVVVLLAVISAIWWATPSRPPPGIALTSVVVLPFESVTGDAAEEPLLGFLRDELSGRLADLEGVEKVISRYSAVRVAGAAPLRVAEELDVDAVVTATATLANDSVTLSVELNAGREDRVLMSDVYIRPVRNVRTLLNDITQDLAGALQVTLAADERTRLQKEEPVEAAALRAWTLGNAEMHELTIDGLERAIAFFREAIAIDRGFARAHAGLAMAYSELAGWWGPPGETEEYAQLARAAAQEALQLDSTAAEAYAALGNAAKYQWDWTTADEALREGMIRSAEASFAHVMYANFLTLMGRYDESIPAAREAVEMDPLAPAVYNELAFALWRSGDVEGARRAFSDSRRVAPDFHQTLHLQSLFHADIGEGERAVRHARRLGDTDPLGDAYNAWVYGVSGHQDQARAIQAELELLEREEPVSPVAFALVHLGLEEWDQALMRLEEAYDRRSPSLAGLKEAPMYDPLRSDPRFQDLVDRMGFPE